MVSWAPSTIDCTRNRHNCRVKSTTMSSQRFPLLIIFIRTHHRSCIILVASRRWCHASFHHIRQRRWRWMQRRSTITVPTSHFHFSPTTRPRRWCVDAIKKAPVIRPPTKNFAFFTATLVQLSYSASTTNRIRYAISKSSCARCDSPTRRVHLPLTIHPHTQVAFL